MFLGVKIPFGVIATDVLPSSIFMIRPPSFISESSALENLWS